MDFRRHKRLPLIVMTALMPMIASPAPSTGGVPVNRTASLVSETVYGLEGEPYGLAGLALKGLFDQCNSFRDAMYKLPAQTLQEELLRLVDTKREEQRFDGRGYALSLFEGTQVELTDLRRWTLELRKSATGQPPAIPPDCTAVERHAERHGELWREGKRYRLDYQKKRAVQQSSRAQDISPLALSPSPVGPQRKQQLIAGQQCSVGGPVVNAQLDILGVDEQCVWNDFGTVAWMNLPLSLRRQAHFGGPTKKIVTRTLASHAEADVTFPDDVFQIPKEFQIVEH